jgi:two-component system, chemotaxis family, sensor kinase CheA
VGISVKFKTRLYIGFGSVIVMLAVILFIVVGLLNNQNSQMSQLVQDRYEKIKLANVIREDVSAIEKEINNIALNPKLTVNNVTVQAIETRNMSILDSIETLKLFDHTDKALSVISELKTQSTEYKTTVDRIISNNLEGQEVEMQQRIKQGELERTILNGSIDRLVSIQEKIMDETIYESTSLYEEAVKYVIISTSIGIFLGIGMAVFIVRGINQRLNRVKTVMSNVDYEAKVFPRIEVAHKDEVGEIAMAYNEMAHALEEHESIERRYMEEIEEQNYIKTKIADFSTMSQGVLDIDELGSQYISHLTKVSGGHYGVLYIKEIIKHEETFIAQATYADTSDTFVNQVKTHIPIGKGLVGQCAKDNELILIDHAPEDYIKITSGLGETAPSSIIIVPVAFEGEVLGVLELATMSKFTRVHKILLEQAANQLGVTLNRIEKYYQVQELLEESQALNEELQTQSEELQMQQEELRTMNDELEAQYRSSEQHTKELERYKNQLEKKNQEVLLGSQYKSEFLANMSHELRTPLNSLIILSQMLYENKGGNLDPKQVEYASTIASSGNDLLRLINDILDLSKIESGKMEIHPDEVLIQDLLLTLERQFTPIAENKGIEFTVHRDDSKTPILFTDEHRLYQILKNLLSNAFKFTEVGQVNLEVGETTMTTKNQQNKEYLTFTVSDTGTGIPKEKQSIIFDAFNQVDGTTSRKHGGTGLGLSISKELSELLGGYILLDSTEGLGSTFTLYLPITEAIVSHHEVAVATDELSTMPLLVDKQDESETKNLDSALKGRKILVVDDDMRNIFALTSALESAGMNVIFAENGQESLQMLSENVEVDLILMDIMMPEMDGYEAMRKIRTMSKYTFLPIIALTAKAMKHDRQRCIDAGASDYISKPINLEQLFSILKVWLHK